MRRTRLIVALAVALAGSALTLAGASLPARTSNLQAVTVTVTPRELGSAKPWEFEVRLNTHVQALTDDLAATAALVDDSGRRHAPEAWRGDGPGGHHREGVLVFAPIEPRPAAIELQIRRAGEPAPRSFRWTLR
ncbi:hypothetical protein [uncultured Piscinibacter sp.]|uniref:hypothetical protein n=1 Tax=uncultured Piscinibacter sp. TaxID=1131835 RepID=UPI00262BF2B3|nr:hypothetical protein [uncultured Piscinibacter sp.]